MKEFVEDIFLIEHILNVMKIFLISSIGLMDKELKEIDKILDGNVGFSKIFNNTIIYNYNTGNLYSEKLLKYKFELERILKNE